MRCIVALSQNDKLWIAEAIATAVRESVPAIVRKPAQAKAAEPFTKTHPCTADPACSRTDLRTLKRASKHGVDEGGHTPR